MKTERFDPLVNALLYEGYLLYPYRASSLKNNRHRFTFGTLYPPAHDSVVEGYERAVQQTECLVVARTRGRPPRLELRARFLRVVDREGREANEIWQEAEERVVALADMTPDKAPPDAPLEARFTLPGERRERDGASLRSATVEGRVQVTLTPLAPLAGTGAAGVFRLRVRVENLTPLPTSPSGDDRAHEAQLRALASTHALLGVEDGRFVSLLEPPANLATAAAACRNEGCYPVLVGEAGRDDAMLASPIILYDHFRLAPESKGDLFDALEIDEILSLRILTLTQEEKAQVRATDARGRALLERIEELGPEGLASLHGARRDAASHGAEMGTRGANRPGVPSLGEQVRLRPRGRADAFDLLLDGKAAHVVGIEEDLEGRVLVAVTIDDDPGRDLGAEGQVGHRFFFAPEELERA